MIKLYCNRCKAEIGVNHQLKEVGGGFYDLCSGCYKDFKRFMNIELL